MKELVHYERRIKLDLYHRFLVMEEEVRQDYIQKISSTDSRKARAEREQRASERYDDDSETEDEESQYAEENEMERRARKDERTQTRYKQLQSAAETDFELEDVEIPEYRVEARRDRSPTPLAPPPPAARHADSIIDGPSLPTHSAAVVAPSPLNRSLVSAPIQSLPTSVGKSTPESPAVVPPEIEVDGDIAKSIGERIKEVLGRCPLSWKQHYYGPAKPYGQMMAHFCHVDIPKIVVEFCDLPSPTASTTLTPTKSISEDVFVINRNHLAAHHAVVEAVLHSEQLIPRVTMEGRIKFFAGRMVCVPCQADAALQWANCLRLDYNGYAWRFSLAPVSPS